MSEFPTEMKAAVVGDPVGDKMTDVKSVPFPKASSKELIIKLIAFAVNPTDWKHIKYSLGQVGAIAGSDVSGVVVSVGADVTGFLEGDYVSSCVRGNVSLDRGAFAEYVVAEPATTLKYDHASISPAELSVGTHESSLINSFEGAASATLGLLTVSLSFGHSLKIDFDASKNANRAILIWGGATATGILAIQLAKLVYGLKVYATASSTHHKFLKSLGADEVFDYSTPDVVEQIKSKANGLIKYALDTVSSHETYQATYDATEGSSECVCLDNLLMLTEKDLKTKADRKACFGATIGYVVTGEDAKLGSIVLKSSPELVKDYNHFWQQVLPKYLPQIRTNNLMVLPKGLESANEALQLNMEGKTKAAKAVWRL